MSILSFLDIGTKLIDKLIPEAGAKDAAKLKLLELSQKGELASLEADTRLAVGQLEVNKAEAASGNAFVSGWRPGVGWVCVVALFSNYLLLPLSAWVAPWTGLPAPPQLDLGELMPLLLGMLGLGGMRSFEKVRGVAK